MGTFRPERREVMATERDLVVLGAGMHPWGKWGKNFVDYGLVAAKAALADADVAWRDIEFVAGAECVRHPRNATECQLQPAGTRTTTCPGLPVRIRTTTGRRAYLIGRGVIAPTVR
jgi:acetyl-CoA acetyltransferase